MQITTDKGSCRLKKLYGLILIFSLAFNLLALGVLDRAIFYRDKIATDETAFYNQGLRTTRYDLMRQTGPPGPGVLLGGNLVRYWFLPAESEIPLVNLGGIEEKVEETYSRLKEVAAQLSPRLAVINAGFCQIHTALHTGRDVEAAMANNLAYLQLMVDEARSRDMVPILSSLAPVRTPFLLPFTGWFDDPFSKPDSENRAIREYNLRVRQLAAEAGLPFFDFHRVLVDSAGELAKPYALTDGEHLSREGYRVLNDFLLSELEKI